MKHDLYAMITHFNNPKGPRDISMDQAQTNQLILISLAGLVVLLVIFVIIHNLRRLSKREEVEEAPVRAFEKKRAVAKKQGIKPLNDMTVYQILTNSKLKSSDILFNLNYTLDEVIGYISSAFVENDAELIFDVDMEAPVMLMGSPSRLAQTLINLLEYLLDRQEINLVMLKVRLVKQDSHLVTLRFEIIQQLPLVPESDLATFFDDPGEEGAAMQINLFVAASLVESEGGRLHVANNNDNATFFNFDLSFKPVPKQHAFHYPVPSHFFSTLQVAIVETHLETARYLRTLLQRYNRNVTMLQPEDLMHDLHIFERFSLVLIDKEILHSALMKDIKQTNELHDLKVVAMENALNRPFDPDHKIIPVDYHINKPFTPERIIEMLTIFYGEQEIGDETEEAPKPAAEETTAPTKGLESFLNDSEIPVMKKITKDQFRKFLGAKVLIVEDNLINQKVIMGLLGDSGISLKLAENGVEALKILDDEAPFDLVLMDINMPVLDGFEATRRIRATPQYAETPVVAFTGLNLPEQIAKMEEVGMNAQMAKPLNVGKFYFIFSQFLPTKEEAETV